MTKTKRSLLVSVLMLLLCVAAVASGTYALFSDSVDFDQHLQAGTLDITLVRTKLVTTELDSRGFLVSNEDNPDTRRVDFTNSIPENAFGIESGDKIVPGYKVEATFEISNNSDVAFGYWIEILCTDEDKKDGQNLAKQLQISVNNADGVFVGEGLIVRGNNSKYIKVLPTPGMDTFTVCIEFLDSDIPEYDIEHNNSAKGEKLDFDLVVKAVQVTDETANP